MNTERPEQQKEPKPRRDPIRTPKHNLARLTKAGLETSSEYILNTQNHPTVISSGESIASIPEANSNIRALHSLTSATRSGRTLNSEGASGSRSL